MSETSQKHSSNNDSPPSELFSPLTSICSFHSCASSELAKRVFTAFDAALVRRRSSVQSVKDSQLDPFPIPFPIDEGRNLDIAFEALPDNNLCSLTGFTGKEKKMLWASWKQMTYDHEDYATFGRDLITWMYDCVPLMPKRFIEVFGEGDIDFDEAAKRFMLHVEGLIKELHTIVTLLPTPIEMMTRIDDLMNFHIDILVPQVGSKYFGLFHQNFHKFLKMRMALSASSHIVKLWVNLIGILYTVNHDKEAEYLKKIEMAELDKLELEKVLLEAEGDEKNKSKCCCRLM